MREPELKELSGASILSLSFFNRLIRRIESTKPIAGTGITITEKESGFEVSSSGDVDGYSAITLNVCSNGTPSTIVVFGKA
jgi:hypothetical protein